jgi:hypothetical protein
LGVFIPVVTSAGSMARLWLIVLAFYATSLLHLMMDSRVDAMAYSIHTLLVLMATAGTLAVRTEWMPMWSVFVYCVLLFHVRITILHA